MVPLTPAKLFLLRLGQLLWYRWKFPRSPLLEIASFHQLTHCRLQQNAVASRANDGLHCLLEALGEEEEGEEFAVEFLW